MRDRPDRPGSKSRDQKTPIRSPAHHRCRIGPVIGQAEDNDIGLHPAKIDQHRRRRQPFRYDPCMRVIFRQPRPIVLQCMYPGGG